MKDQLTKFNKAIVVLKSLYVDSHYVEAYEKDGEGTHMCEVSDSEAALNENIKFKLHVLDAQNHIVCFESMKYRDYYIDMTEEKPWMHDYHYVGLSHSPSIPNKEGNKGNWARFKLFGNNLLNVSIRSERYDNRYLYRNKSGLDININNHVLLAAKADRPNYTNFRFKIDTPDDPQLNWITVSALHSEKKDGDKIKYTYEHKKGVASTRTITKETSISIAQEVSAGIEAKGVSGGSKTTVQMTHTFTEQMSVMKSLVETQIFEMTLGESSKNVQVKQAVIHYGDSDVHLNYFKVIFSDGNGDNEEMGTSESFGHR